MATYGSIAEKGDHGEVGNESHFNDEGRALVGDRITIADRPSSFKRYLVGAVVALCFLAVGLHHRHYGATSTTKNAQSFMTRGNAASSNQLPQVCKTADKNPCGDGMVCCTKVTGALGVCRSCCTDFDCISRIKQPVAGEFGEPFCLNKPFNNQCRSFVKEESSIPEDGYPVYLPSETFDNSRSYHKIVQPRKVFTDDPSDPVMESSWYFDFNEQGDDFDIGGVSTNGTHITIPSYEKLHAGYSKRYKPFDEQETGIVTLVLTDNKVSVVADYPKVSFVEKYHALTFDGEKDEARGKYMNELSAKQMKLVNDDEFKRRFGDRTLTQALALTRRKGINQQVEAGIDRALNWQIRRYVNTYTDDGAVTPTSSSSWASHSLKAQQAIQLAKDPNFEREHYKSEQHCKHLEEGEGFTVDFTNNSVTIPLGRPITTFSGEMINAPSHYLGLNTGTMTAHYDDENKIFQIFFQGYAASRQYSDFKFPGPKGFGGLFLGPVAKGSDYYVDPHKDGRGDVFVRDTAPGNEILSGRFKLFRKQPDVTLWHRPLEVRCKEGVVEKPFWEKIDVAPGDNSIFQTLGERKDMLKGIIKGMPCATQWMRADYGEGSHNFGPNEIGVWAHSLGEIRDDKTKEITLAPWWDEWECFYQKKDLTKCY